ncbi:NAD-glutamate dehydrogenase domain-containing protein [Alteraurantiacibacter aquimixticola]|uniref:Glutamate dehydrogenase n=1 Tax=Alteraurantiacibacter aquimixticola TaxID=2489173 RepID=A0A4T3EYR7_9SPHN|nr:NAD-glutamate dehydrogenase domain-containing protein [Alteraurantiacibacter aquimixticola]TIX49009.1 glutamate dehydrogenase [Alteraurantiacibacter aquimixticola]
MAKAKAAAKKPTGKAKHLAILRERIADSILPGETGLEGKALDDAASFLLEAAQSREDGKPSILIRTSADGKRMTRIAVVNRDVPFLVDSVSRAIADSGLTVELLVHPILPVRRDPKRNLTDLPDTAEAGEKRESFIYVETERVDAKLRRTLEADLAAAIADVRAAVADWPQMQALMERDADKLSDAEGAALLRWLCGGMMTQLGHVTRHRDGKQADQLGICRKSARELLADATWERAFAWFDGAGGRPGRAPLIVKANRLSKVHRRAPLDLFILPLIEDGRVAALSTHVGIWTSAALMAAPANVPVLRQQLEAIGEELDFVAGSHDHKALIHSLSVLPHDLMISFSESDTLRVATTMMALIDRPRPRVAMVAAPLERHIFAFVWLPRDMLSTDVRLQIEGLLERETGASTLDWSLMVEGGSLALLRYVLDARHSTGVPDDNAVDAHLQDMLRGWTDAVESALAESEEPSRAAALALRHAGSFPPAYRSAYGPLEAARDIERLRHLSPEDGHELGRDARLYRHAADAEDRLRLKVYQASGALPLSDAVPALEHFGFRVLSEIPTELAGEDIGTIHDFLLGMPPGEDSAPLLERSEAIEQAICGVLNARAENDVFNRLVISTGISAQEAEWLRAFYRYLRQANIAFTIYTVVDALAAAPEVTRAIIELFRTRHDPAFKGDREKATAAAEEAIRVGLANVNAINDDRILRLYWQTIAAILRTNVFAPAAAEALAFKIDSALVPGLPKPVPWREIFVYSRRVEGIHLRAGPVARGGIRWSDRRDDFRTEILGLMKAQRVKNAVIVPTGAKGGFFPKQLPNPALDRDAWFTEGRESYKVFIRTLLSVTDNLVDDKVVHPENVVIHDGEDPYFVVAADKGTATFSDTANAIAIEHDFWLGDAFASGGSNGYDHKAMGITARGAWISVQRHFLEMGVDVQKEPVEVVGCGDMSGDVFGNGMLLSKAIKLVAAFDHRHIFIDPDPDPAASWKERKRLFDLPRSNWAEYDDSLLSKGGGIFPRSMKRIPLSAQARKVLGVEDKELDPDSLISAILKAPVGLVWFGGIGTYIKAESETNAQVGDPANDSLRVNAHEVRAKVIGEGANLGATQAGRIEFALRGAEGIGGRINTDFIDNSAGVDCSDNEVNIKIALAPARKAGRLSEAKRNVLLEDMTEAVAELVLEDNRLQALALSIAQQGGANAMGAQLRLIEALEEMGELDRKTEGLAGSDVLSRRAADGHGLTRPELAVLLSSTKLVLQDAVEKSGLAADKAAEALVLDDFPPQLQEKFAPALLDHRLRTEIVGTVVANRIVNRMGMVHPFELAEEEGAGLDRVGCAFVSACNLLGMEALWDSVDATAMSEEARLALFSHAAQALRSHMADLLRAGGCGIGPAKLKADIGPLVDALSDQAEGLLGLEARSHVAAIAEELESKGAPAKLAQGVARLYALDGAIGLAMLARDSKVAPLDLVNAFVALGSLLGLDWAQARAAVMTPSDPWERLLVAGLARDFQQMRFDFLRHLSGGRSAKSPLDTRIDNWAQDHEAAIAQFRRVIARAQASAPVSSAVLAQIASQARNLLQR